MYWRVTLSHEVEGSLVIALPDGWKSMTTNLERHPDFFSVRERFDTPLDFTGINSLIGFNGGREFLLLIEKNYGPDATVLILWEKSIDNVNWTTFLDQELVISHTFAQTVGGERKDNRIQSTPSDRGLWAKFINNAQTPVDIKSVLDLYGVAVTPAVEKNLRLTNQIINYYGEYRFRQSVTYSNATGEWDGFQIDWDDIVLDDIQKVPVGNDLITSKSTGGVLYNDALAQFVAPWDGVYQFDFQNIYAAYNSGLDEWVSPGGGFRIGKLGLPSSNHFPIADTSYYSDADDSINKAAFVGSFRLKRGESIVVYYITDPENFTIFGELRISYKTDCDLATTSSISLTGEQVIDGTLTSASKVFAWQQVNPAENGAYITAAGAWTRVSDLDTAAEFINAGVKITSGSIYGGAYFYQTNSAIAVLGTDENVWEEFTGSKEHSRPYPPLAPAVVNYCKVTALTEFKETTVPAFLLHDVAHAVINRITDADKLHAPVMGSSETSIVYDEDGAYWKYVILQGLQARGLSLAAKPFSISFMDIWKGADPHFNLGCGTKYFDGVEKIYIDKKEKFFDTSRVSIRLSGVHTLRRAYDSDYQFNKITQGAETGEIEDISGLDDLLSSVVSTLFKKIGKGFENLSKFISTGLTLEQCRRTPITKDYKYDNNVFIVAVEADGAGYKPELSENFSAVTGLLNEETRYNKRLLPMRSFLRWKNFYAGCVQAYLTSFFEFRTGKGNYGISTTMNDNGDVESYGGNPLPENGSIAVAGDFLFTPMPYEITDHPITTAQITALLADKEACIEVSQSNSGHKKLFIKSAKITFDGKMSAVLWPKEFFDLVDTTPGRVFGPEFLDFG